MTVAVFGANGRVGKVVCDIARKRGHVVVPIEKGDAPLADVNGKTDVAIDFSAAEATEQVCKFCRAHRCSLVTGVTGRNEAQQYMLDELAQEVTVVAESNFAEGVNALYRLVETLSRLLPDWDAEIVEIHRREKRDAPSGTAKKLAAIAAQRKNFRKVTVHSLRCGSNFGRHEVIFAAQGESLTLVHQAENCEIFAKGAVIRAEKLYALAQKVSD